MIHFCTFGNMPQYSRSIEELVNEARISKYFDTITVYTQYNLPNIENHRKFIESNPRGYGYWIWKPILLLDMLSKVNDNDIIIYADAGNGISTSDNAKKNFKLWINTVTNVEPFRLSFQTPHLEKSYTKYCLFEIMNCTDSRYTESGQYAANIQIYKKTCENVDFINEYYCISCLDPRAFQTGTYST